MVQLRIGKLDIHSQAFNHAGRVIDKGKCREISQGALGVQWNELFCPDSVCGQVVRLGEGLRKQRENLGRSLIVVDNVGIVISVKEADLDQSAIFRNRIVLVSRSDGAGQTSWHASCTGRSQAS